jgi:hypothetical protein
VPVEGAGWAEIDGKKYIYEKKGFKEMRVE